jgi:hypothetical protein
MERTPGNAARTQPITPDNLRMLKRMEARKLDYEGTDPIITISDQNKIARKLAERGFIEQILEYIFALSLQEYCKHYQRLDLSGKYTLLDELTFFMPGPQSSKMLQGYFETGSKTELETLLQKLLTHVKTPSMSEKDLKRILDAIRALPEKARILLPDGNRPLSLLKKELEIIIPSTKLYLPFCSLIDERDPRVVDALKKVKRINDPAGNKSVEIIFQDQTH